ncbi:hypothetical protein [Micromonospora sp. KC721]|uniref:hypothetical protein n=1 Tax=Micromonospora sp. KC721 TaxID=2530380 RepID=UPI001043C99D|nr:hypothetical protein [Micromonospora sp. KC721]TDB81778.1 hypothetical protein E1182_04120 [Micromonospora sp. KC721]
MDAAAWRTMGRACPGPVGLAAWVAVTLPAPLLFFEGTHRWEERQDVSTALWWTLGAVPVLAAGVAASWTRCTGRRRTSSGLLTAVGVAMLVSAVFLGASMAVYRWVVPLQGAAGWRGVLSSGALLVAAGAVIGYLVGLGNGRRRRLSDRHGYLIGVMMAVVGVLLAEVTVRLGAEDSTSGYEVISHGGVGPYGAAAGEPGVVTLPAGGRYAILAVGFAPHDPDCRVTGAGASGRPAKLVTVAPGDYGTDAAAYAWVASFDVPDAGVYSLNCRSSDDQASYLVGKPPDIRGAVGELVHWPLVAIWLLGAVPGLLVIAHTANRRRAERREVPAPA